MIFLRESEAGARTRALEGFPPAASDPNPRGNPFARGQSFARAGGEELIVAAAAAWPAFFFPNSPPLMRSFAGITTGISRRIISVIRFVCFCWRFCHSANVFDENNRFQKCDRRLENLVDSKRE